MLNRHRPLLASLALFALLVSLLPQRSASANTEFLSQTEAVALLRAYSIVRGDPSGNLGLDQRLTRAQAAALFIRSFNAEDMARMLAPVVPFPDAQGHWAAGEIAVAERLGLMRGDPSGNFRPEADITYAEVLTVLLRMVKREPEGPWDPVRIMSAAASIGVAPQGIQPSERAVRGQIFWSLANTIAKVPLSNGKTVLQQHVDSTPPQISFERNEITTADRTVTISGVAPGASQVTVGAVPATLNPTTGAFSLEVPLEYGANEFVAEATDLAGNIATSRFTATRQVHIARITVTGPDTVRAGTSTRLTVAALDAQNNAVPLTGATAEMTGNVATFDLASQTLAAGNATGSGRLTIRSGNVSGSYSFEVTAPSSRASQLRIVSINDGRSPAVGKAATVKVQVVDVNGNAVTDDYWREISLSVAGLSGVTVSPPTAVTQKGEVSFSVTGTVQGTATLTARSTNLVEASEVTEFLSTTRVILTANPTSLRPDGLHAASIRAALQDDEGRTVTNNTDSDIRITLTASGSDGELTDNTLTIRRGASNSSGDDGAFRAGVRSVTATVTGRITTNHNFAVQTLSLPVTAALPGTALQFTFPTSRQTPGGPASTITVRVVDSAGRTVTTGSYAFQFVVTTSNDDPLVGGLPEGVELNFPNTVYRPVDDGRPATDPLNDPNAVVGRTHQGTATLQLRYSKSGILTLTPKLVGATSEAYHPTGGFAPASASSAMSADAFSVTFAGNPASIQLTVDSRLGRDQAGGAVSSATTMVVRAQVVDASGTPVPGYTSDVTLTRQSGGSQATNISGANRKAAVNGKAEFSVAATATAGFDRYIATSGSLTSQPVTIAVRTARAETPTIAAIRGVKTGDPSPTTGYVAPDADFMDIQLFPQDPPNSGEPTYWVTASVFRKGESSPFFTSDAINLRSDLPIIRIPKSLLRTGRAVYEVVINNGAGDTARSPDLGLSEAVNAVYNNNYRINSALYDAETGRLLLSAANLVSNGVVHTDKLSVVKGDQVLNLGDPAVTVQSVASSSVDLRLGALAGLLSPDLYHGTVIIRAEDGWFSSPDGVNIARGSDSATVRPMAVITQVTLDVPERRLFLHGQGFSQGTLQLNLIRIQKAGGDSVVLNPGTATTTDRITSTTDALVTITLSQATLDAISNLQGPDLFLTAETGWLRHTSGGTWKVGAVSGPGLYVRATITSVQYNRTTRELTLRGSGFGGGTLQSGKLIFRATGLTATWTPSSSGTAVAGDDTTIILTLSEADATQFLQRYSGRTVFLNTDEGWLVDGRSRIAASIPINSVLFSVPAQ